MTCKIVGAYADPFDLRPFSRARLITDRHRFCNPTFDELVAAGDAIRLVHAGEDQRGLFKAHGDPKPLEVLWIFRPNFRGASGALGCLRSSGLAVSIAGRSLNQGSVPQWTRYAIVDESDGEKVKALRERFEDESLANCRDAAIANCARSSDIADALAWAEQAHAVAPALRAETLGALAALRGLRSPVDGEAVIAMARQSLGAEFAGEVRAAARAFRAEIFER